ncbi:2-C-methyl-D-erythritol 4-phosphate cytidylyltransferase [Crenobacter cavernae]|uniref:2-C-methyl-D-erythritol 4-phosphate cytidylyltransferase n=1 Tax=Crenobacter cavernae TaxID=2290923 RepID=A0A345Y9W4_9NEIS|nr:2-C-methyl-D-erythritol 4-phosphate cytidylyltransferase [Crenobacter cavernae]AXK40716.1 2-C-methyl-D-erythritol 4-phosphate cytidylyltransferase [Crenobacter cavernae]
MSRHIALVPAAGSGSRIGSAVPKQYLPLAGRPLLAHTLAALLVHPAIDAVAVVISPEDEWFDRYVWPLERLAVLRCGGASRAESVASGLVQLALDDDDWVLVHDAARVGISQAALTRLIATLASDPVGGLLALPVPDTVKRGDADGRVADTLPRAGLWLAQTPQMFRAGLLKQALAAAPLAEITDEASAIERLGLSPRLVEGEAGNFKVTYPQDLSLAEALLSARAG